MTTLKQEKILAQGRCNFALVLIIFLQNIKLTVNQVTFTKTPITLSQFNIEK